VSAVTASQAPAVAAFPIASASAASTARAAGPPWALPWATASDRAGRVAQSPRFSAVVLDGAIRVPPSNPVGDATIEPLGFAVVSEVPERELWNRDAGTIHCMGGDADRAMRAARRAEYPGEVVRSGSAKPALYAGLTAAERLARMTALCRNQFLAAGGRIEELPRERWPGQVFRIERG